MVTDIQTAIRMDIGRTDGQTLLLRCKDASKNTTLNVTFIVLLHAHIMTVSYWLSRNWHLLQTFFFYLDLDDVICETNHI